MIVLFWCCSILSIQLCSLVPAVHLPHLVTNHQAPLHPFQPNYLTVHKVCGAWQSSQRPPVAMSDPQVSAFCHHQQPVPSFQR